MTDDITTSRALKAKHPSDGLICKLSVVSQGSREELSLRLIVGNPTKNRLQFCTYHTPFEGIRNDIFVVLDAQGDEMDYRGMMAKRAPPDKNDFVVLKAGASKSVEFNPGRAYEFQPGSYTIQFRGGGISMLPDSNAVSLKLS